MKLRVLVLQHLLLANDRYAMKRNMLVCVILFVLAVVLLFMRINVTTHYEPFVQDQLMLALGYESRPGRFEQILTDFPELVNLTRSNPACNNMPVLAEWASRACKDDYFIEHVRIMIKKGSDKEVAIEWLLLNKDKEPASFLENISLLEEEKDPPKTSFETR